MRAPTRAPTGGADAPDEPLPEIDENAPVTVTVDGAWYARPTTRHDHGALGDAIEAGALTLGLSDGTQVTATLPQSEVFEDRLPRLLDLEGFGATHVVTIASDVNEGASAAVFELVDGALALVGRTPFIGADGWLNIAGIDDFDGAGFAQIALVEKPHGSGRLQFWRWSPRQEGGPLRLVAQAPEGMGGFSNHAFGSREQRLSAVEDFDDDGVLDLALPSSDRRTLRLVKLSAIRNPKVEEIATVPLPAPIDKAIGVTRRTLDGRADVVLTVGLEDGTVWAVHQAR